MGFEPLLPEFDDQRLGPRATPPRHHFCTTFQFLLDVHGCPRPFIALQVQNRGLKHHSFNLIFTGCVWNCVFPREAHFLETSIGYALDIKFRLGAPFPNQSIPV